jgi:hypothetical protein
MAELGYLQQEDQSTQVLFEGRILGYIYPPSWSSIQRLYAIRLIKKLEKKPAVAISIRPKFKSLDSAKAYLNKHSDKVIQVCKYGSLKTPKKNSTPNS